MIRLFLIVVLCSFALLIQAQTDTLSLFKSDSTVSVANDVLDSDAEIEDDVPVYFNEADTVALYSEGFNGLSKLNKIVDQYKVFITGENHTYTESNARLWLKMIKYLYQYAGVRNIMFEYGYSYGFLVNEYLRTGDTTLFGSIDQFAYIEYSNALEELKAFNDSLPEGEKLYFAAIDIERGIYPIAKILAYLLPDSVPLHDSIALHVMSLKSLAAYNDFKLDEQDQGEKMNLGFQFRSGATLDLVHQNFMRFEEEYKALLGERFDEFRVIIVDNYLARKQWKQYESLGAIQEYIYRENYMHNRFLKEYAAHKGKWFGQFGRCHTTLTKQASNSCEWFEFNSLADRIENTRDGRFKDSVMSIAILYKDDRKTAPNRDSMGTRFDDYFLDIEDNSIVLFDLSIDTTLYKAYGKDFKYLFLNTNTKRGEVYQYLEVVEEAVASDESKASIAGVVGNYFFDLSDFNKAIPSSVVDDDLPFNGSITSYGMAFGGEQGQFGSGLEFGIFQGQSYSNSGLSYKLDGYYIDNISYYSVFKSLEKVDLKVGTSFGYHQFKLSIHQPNPNGTIGFGYIGNQRYIVYTNPAFVAGLSTAVNVNVGPAILGLRLGRNFDLSKKQWLSDGNRIVDSPRTSLTANYGSVHIGVRF